jgi:hypothetical protein
MIHTLNIPEAVLAAFHSVEEKEQENIKRLFHDVTRWG